MATAIKSRPSARRGVLDNEKRSEMDDELDDGAARYVAVGDVVAGKYLVERVLGTGATSFVVAARHLDLDGTVALKFLTKNLTLDAVVVARFMREARAACQVHSKHVARVYDVGTHERAPFVVMEHVHGRDLSAVLRTEGPLRVETAVEYVLHACKALAAAHAAGIVQRDVTPESLSLVDLAGAPCVKLLDCGISKPALVESEGRRVRLRGELSIGTPSYLAPEQIRSSSAADAQSNVWSLGAVLYELLTGAPAFSGVTVTEVCAAVLESTPAAITEFRSDVPRGLVEVIATAMDKDRRRRSPNVAELAAALLPFARQEVRMAAEREGWSLAQRAGASSISSTPTSWTRAEEILPPPVRYAPAEDEPGQSRAGSLARAAVLVGTLIGAVALYVAMAPQTASRLGAAPPVAQAMSLAPVAAPAVAPAQRDTKAQVDGARAASLPRAHEKASRGFVSSAAANVRKAVASSPPSLRTSSPAARPSSTATPRHRVVDLGY
jgi:serine/threonine-protein kinase